MHSIPDLEASPVIPVFRWRHALERDKEIMQTARSGQAAGESGIENASTAAQLLLGVSQGKRLEIFFWADANPTLEQPLKVMRTEIHSACGLAQRRLLARARTQKRQGLCRARVVRLPLVAPFRHTDQE